MSEKWIQILGLTTALGGVAGGLSGAVGPSGSSVNSRPEIVASLVFQVGLLALLAVMWVTEATGPHRAARTVLAAELVAVVLAGVWTLPHLLDADRRPTMLLQALDTFRGISMLGTLVVGIMVVRAHRWPTPLRFLPVTASLLLLLGVSLAWAPAAFRSTLSDVSIATSYGVLGLAMVASARRLAELAPQRPARDEQVATGT